jgi:hypothetical protein
VSQKGFCRGFSHDEQQIGRTESHEQLFFACNLGTADEREYGGRWNQLLCKPSVSCDVNSLRHVTSITPNKMADNDMSFCQRAVIEFLVKEEIPATEIHQTSACLWKCVHACEQYSKMGETF